MIPLKNVLRPLLLAALALLAIGAPARAASNELTYVEAPRDLTAVGSTDASRASAFNDFDALGVQALRVNLRWYDVAPSPDSATKPSGAMNDPGAYNWGAYGTVIDEAKAKGFQVMISLAGPVPKWATAAKADNITRPSAQEYRFFAAAAAKRFGGPTVIWSIWNEPNLDVFLRPLVSGGKLVAPQIYRELYLAGYAGIKDDAGLTTTKVLFGDTAPVGAADANHRIYPLLFLRQALCLTSKLKLDKACGSRLPVDGFAHHPYQFSNMTLNANDVTYRNLGRLTTFLDKAAKGGAIPAGMPIYLNEFGIQSKPDKFLGVTYLAQYEMRARAERAAFYNKRVRGFSQYLLTDDTDDGGFQSGLRLANGKAKPAYNAFRLTLDAKPAGRGKRPKTSLWGLVRTARSAVTVNVEVSINGAAFKPLKTLTTNRLGAFTLTDAYRKKPRYRFTTTTADGSTLTSPPVDVFAGWVPPNSR